MADFLARGWLRPSSTGAAASWGLGNSSTLLSVSCTRFTSLKVALLVGKGMVLQEGERKERRGGGGGVRQRSRAYTVLYTAAAPTVKILAGKHFANPFQIPVQSHRYFLGP